MKLCFFISLTLTISLVAVGCRKSPSVDNQPIAPAHPYATSPPGKAAVSPEPTADKPALSCQVQNLSIYPVPNNPENLAVSLVVLVRNSGSPSTAQDWTLTVYSPNRSDLTAFAPVHVNGVVDMPGAKGARVDLGKDDLALRSKETTLDKNAQIKGVLTFVLPKTSTQDLTNNQSSLVLHFKDNQGNPYRSSKTVIGVKASQ